jgi:hypothetical protein
MSAETSRYWRDIGRSRIVGSGGENIVHSYNGQVAKINELFVREYLKGGITEEDIQKEITKRRKRHTILTQSFGKAHVPYEHSDLFRVTLSAEECAALVPEHPISANFSFIPTMIIFQEVVPEVEKDALPFTRKAKSLGDGEYAEERFDPTDPNAFSLYEMASNHFVLGKGKMPFLSYDSHAGIWAPHTWKDIRASEWNSPAMRDLAVGFQTFTDNTSQNGDAECLDIEGINNIVFLPQKDDQVADFKLIDALYPFPLLTLRQVRELLLKVNETDMPILSSSDKAKLMNGVNYLRIANAIIEFSGSNIDLLHPFPDGIAWRADIWRRVFTLSREFLVERGMAQSLPDIL